MVKAPSYGHPLDALTAEEIRACSKACNTYAAEHELDALRFNVVSLKVNVWTDGNAGISNRSQIRLHSMHSQYNRQNTS